MKLATALPLLAALSFASPALAQMGPPGDGMGMGMGMGSPARHAEMCKNHYAHAVGKLAEVEVRLNLTAAQKPLFARWKDVKLAQAKAFAAKCDDVKPLGRDASIVDHRERQIARLEQHLADLKAETPSLEALAKTLSPEQEKVLKRVAMEMIGHRMERMGHFMDRMHAGHGRMMERHMEMPKDAPPPAN